MNIGFTGINGWIGSFISNYFINKKYNVYDLGDWTRSFGIEQQSKDFHSIDWAFHFGASTSIKDSYIKPFSFYLNNTNSTIQLLKIVKEKNAKLIFMSSYLYGNPDYLPIDEKHPISIINPYSSSKYLSEQICTEICNQLGIEYIIFRLFNIYAPGVCKGRLISDILESAINEVPFNLNDPLPSRDYLYVKDLAALLEIIINNEILKSGEIYNIGYGKSHSNSDVVKIVENIVGKKLKVIISNGKREKDAISIKVNTAKIMSDYDWKPTYNIKSGLKDILFSHYKKSINEL